MLNGRTNLELPCYSILVLVAIKLLMPLEFLNGLDELGLHKLNLRFPKGLRLRINRLTTQSLNATLDAGTHRACFLDKILEIFIASTVVRTHFLKQMGV